MALVTAEKINKELLIKARGLSIAKACSLARIAEREYGFKIESIQLSDDEMKIEERTSKVTAIVISIKKP